MHDALPLNGGCLCGAITVARAEPGFRAECGVENYSEERPVAFDPGRPQQHITAAEVHTLLAGD